MRTGAMEAIKRMLARVSRDKRVIIPLIGCALAAFWRVWQASARSLGPELAVIVGSVVSLALVKPCAGKPVPAGYGMGVLSRDAGGVGKDMPALAAYLPFILIFAFLLMTSKLIRPVNSFWGRSSSSFQIPTAVGAGKTSFSRVNAPDVLMFMAAIIAAFVTGSGLTTLIFTLERE